MTKKEYREYLKSDHWKEIREKRIKLDNHRYYLCGKASGLNVHHLRYDVLWNEDVRNDLVSLCYKCHSMLHRVMDSSKKEYRCFKEEHTKNPNSNKEKYLYNSLENRIKSSLVEELWLRDSSFGGDLNIFYDDMKTVKRIMKIIKLIYPDIKEFDISGDIMNRFKTASLVLSNKEITEEKTKNINNISNNEMWRKRKIKNKKNLGKRKVKRAKTKSSR